MASFHPITSREAVLSDSESLEVWWQQGLTSSMTDTKRPSWSRRDTEAILPLSSPSPGLATPPPNPNQCHCLLVHRTSKDLAGSLWGHITMTSHSWKCLLLGGCNAFTVLIKTEARTQGPLYINGINNSGSSALFTRSNWWPLGGGDTPVCFLEYTRHCPSSLLSVRCFQESEFSLLYSSLFLLDQVTLNLLR